jgi:hypothetical protein
MAQKEIGRKENETEDFGIRNFAPLDTTTDFTSHI